MPHFDDARQLLAATRDRLDGWIYEARREAYAELFEASEPVLSADEVATLDRLDSQLRRTTGTGVWGENEFGIAPAGAIEEESVPRVVATYYPQIPASVHDGTAPIDEESRARFNDALWSYTERVVELVQERLEAFVWSSEVDAWAE